MRSRVFAGIALTALLLTLSAGCWNHDKPPRNSTPDGVKASSNGGSKPKETDAATGNLKQVGSTGAEDDGGTPVVLVDNKVALKQKGATDFEPINEAFQFYDGDTLQIGANSSVLVSCKEVCRLSTGLYTSCCTNDCKVEWPPSRSGADGEQLFMLKKDLSPAEAKVLAESESKLLNLGLGKTTTQFLKAKLYTSWRLKEAEDELATLSAQLEKPEARQELGKIYAPVSRKTGDMFVVVNQKDRAIHEYQKVIANPPQATVVQPDALKEKAAAHTALADVLVESGKKAEAQENLKAAKRIYVRQGDANKAAVLDHKIRVASKPD